MKKTLESKLEATERRMLRWSCGRTMIDRILNEVFRNALEVAPISAKVSEGRLRWFGHVRRRLVSAPLRRVENLFVVGKKERQTDEVVGGELRLDLKALNICETMTTYRCSWSRQIRVVDSFFGNNFVVESLMVDLSRLALT
ncbi:hypothetical protein OROGR_014798 [Orobanche gracilis]